MTVQLTGHQINVFKIKLNDRFMVLRREISAELLHFDEERYVDLAGRVHDTGEEALADLLGGHRIGLRRSPRQEIRDIDAALMRIADGCYGKCCDCQ
ncbi:MAG: TraR/DksA family transcriptional regulator, partial [Halobacteriota archaeon]